MARRSHTLEPCEKGRVGGLLEKRDLSDAGQARTTADFIGIAVHCAGFSEMCASQNHGQPDLLPDEPGGYQGFNGLFGHKYIAPIFSPRGQLTDLDGNVIANGADVGFPGFNGMPATVFLSYIAAMQEHGIPVTYAYISAAHEQDDTGLGPGDPTYERNLRNYDAAFGKFFARLARDGIDKSNTIFVVAADENDYFTGTPPLNPGCNGVTVTCAYDPNKLGSVEVGLDVALHQKGITTQFDVHSDSAVGFYLTHNPGQMDPLTRQFERAVSQPVITRTWASVVGPGVEHRGIVDDVWSDHTDVRPTVLAALGLHDRYQHDGRVLTEILASLELRSETLAELMRRYTQINAPVGQLALATIKATTRAMRSGTSSDDDRYVRVNRQISALPPTARRHLHPIESDRRPRPRHRETGSSDPAQTGAARPLPGFAKLGCRYGSHSRG